MAGRIGHLRLGQPHLRYPRCVARERNAPHDPDHDESVGSLDDYDPESIEEPPIKFALGRIANSRNAACTRFTKKG